jgi:hypothetical protein
MKRFAILSPSSVYPAELVAMMHEYGFKKEQVDLIDFKSLDKKYLFGDDVISVSNAKEYDFNNCNAVIIADDINLSSSFMDKMKSYNIKIIIHSHIFGTDIKPSMADFVKNNDDKFIPIQQILSNKVKLQFNDYPIFAGNFGIYKKDEIVRNISFNYNRSESNLEQSQNQLLSDYKVVKSIETVFNSLLSDRSNDEIWKIFVLLSLLFLFLEVLIQKLVK